MFALGWVHDEANAEELVVREGTYFSMKEVSRKPGRAFACTAGMAALCMARQGSAAVVCVLHEQFPQIGDEHGDERAVCRTAALHRSSGSAAVVCRTCVTDLHQGRLYAPGSNFGINLV
jgi:hypothetical protein